MKKSITIIIAIIILLTFSGCSSMGSLTSGGRIISVATVQPENHPISVGLRAMKDYIEKELNDGTEVKIYYNSIMGGNSQALELLQMGTLNFVATSGSNLESFDDTYKIFGIPYLFNDEESFRNCMTNPEFINKVYDSTKSKGIQGVTWFANGVNNIYSSKPVRSPEDIKGKKFRIQASEANVMLAKGWGAAATVLAYSEVYTAFQNGVIDLASNPEMALVNVKHGEVAPYYTYTEHQIFTDMLVANVDFLNSLSEREKSVLDEAYKIANITECEEWDKQTEECITEAKKMGVEFIEVDKTEFRRLQEPVRDELINLSPELKELNEIVDKMQGGNNE